jgi:outer membrane receptor protein involved in Fe transport
MRVSTKLAPAGLLLLLLAPRGSAAQQPAAADALGLDSLLNVPISASGKYQETARQAASSVTIITRELIEGFGYRTMEEMLAGVAGFYLSNDRNYSYLGARGFSRPTDFNNRFLLLVDGHALNDGIWGSAPLELPVDLQSLERVEIVRGPGSALYGTGAVLGVINLVTRSGSALGATHLAVHGGSYGRRGASAVIDRRFKSGLGLAITGTWDASDGQDLFYPEYEAPATHLGVAHNLDWERRWLVQAKAERGDLTFSGWLSRRVKAIPTGSYGMTFDASPAQTADSYGFAELRYEHDLDASKQVRLRGFVDRYAYEGIYPYDGYDYLDRARDESVGTEASFRWNIGSAQHLTVGAEYRRHLRGMYAATSSLDDSGVAGYHVPYTVASAFVEHEFQPIAHVTVLGGIRVDDYTATGSSVTPRAAVLYDPARGTTLKLLYGRAFRAPNLNESQLDGFGYKLNPSLHDERGNTLELVLQQRLGTALLGTASLFRYHMEGLIDPMLDPADSLYIYRNTGEAEAGGAELSLEARFGDGVMGYANYSYQVATDEGTGAVLTNSPTHLVKAGVAAPLARWVGGALEGRGESGRVTVYGTRTGAYAIGSMYVWFSPLGGTANEGPVQISLRVNNLFNATYATPAGPEHLQPSIEQDRRNVSAELRYRF